MVRLLVEIAAGLAANNRIRDTKEIPRMAVEIAGTLMLKEVPLARIAIEQQIALKLAQAKEHAEAKAKTTQEDTAVCDGK
jgi:hypothetical protein